MAIPGAEKALSTGIQKAMTAFVWPQRLTVPLAPQFATALTNRPSGALLVVVKQARGEPRHGSVQRPHAPPRAPRMEPLRSRARRRAACRMCG